MEPKDSNQEQPQVTKKPNKKQTKLKKELESLEVKISQLESEIQSEKDRNLRLFAEFENFRKRTTSERVELFKTAGQEVLQSLLPILDDFDRALSEMHKRDDEPMTRGVDLIHSKLTETLKQKGLQQMEVAAGDVFDADFHEAITQVPAPSEDLKGKIIDVVSKGYQISDKIIRYPKVVVGQ